MCVTSADKGYTIVGIASKSAFIFVCPVSSVHALDDAAPSLFDDVRFHRTALPKRMGGDGYPALPVHFAKEFLGVKARSKSLQRAKYQKIPGKGRVLHAEYDA